MSLGSVLRTGVSGLNAQSTKLGTISDNIANSGTTGYKRAGVEFASLVINASSNSYTPGAVETNVRYAISEQGALTFTTSPTDLAIQGEGFFVVTDVNGDPRLTRAGAFQVDGGSGHMVNAAGYTLMGVDISADPDAQPPANNLDGLVPIDVDAMNMQATATSNIDFVANLDINEPVIAIGDPPQAVTSVTAFTQQGAPIDIDFEFRRTAATQVTLTTQVAGGFAENFVLDFNADGSLATPMPLTIPVGDFPAGPPPAMPGDVTLDLTGTSLLSEEYQPLDVRTDGNAPAVVDEVDVSEDGTVFAVYENGARVAFYRLALADVPSPDKLLPSSGTVFQPTLESGDVLLSYPTEGGNGRVLSGALEQSNVDLANELTEMVIAQRDYTANTRSFQTGNELLEVLINLGR